MSRGYSNPIAISSERISASPPFFLASLTAPPYSCNSWVELNSTRISWQWFLVQPLWKRNLFLGLQAIRCCSWKCLALCVVWKWEKWFLQKLVFILKGRIWLRLILTKSATALHSRHTKRKRFPSPFYLFLFSFCLYSHIYLEPYIIIYIVCVCIYIYSTVLCKESKV